MNKTKFLNHLVAHANKDRPTDIDLKEAHDRELEELQYTPKHKPRKEREEECR